MEQNALLLIERNVLEDMNKIGILKETVLRDMEIFEFWKEQSSENGSMQAVTNAAARYCLSEKTIERIVYKMKKLCQSS